jgi:outer membrane immunogenic protein
MKMRIALLSTVSSLALAGSAAAADIAVKAPAPVVLISTWAGWYIGVHGGAARHDFSIIANDEGSSVTGSVTGGVVGGQIGYNWQQRYFVYGLEADASWADLSRTLTSGETTLSTPPSPFTTVTRTKVDWLSSFRGRAGLALEDTYLFVTGGLALGHVFNGWGNGYSIPFNTCCEASSSKTRVGFVGGFGVEHKVTEHVTIRAEGLYYDLGRDTVAAVLPTKGGAPEAFQGESTNAVIVARAGINLKW